MSQAEDSRPAAGAPVERPVRPWGTRIDPDAQPVGYDRRQGDILRWREPQTGLLYDQAALDAAVAAERERIAKHFDSRDTGTGGFYEPHEPAEIIRALGPNGPHQRETTALTK